MLELDDQTLLHLVDKGMVKESPCRRSRTFKWCVEVGGRGVSSSDVHHLAQKPVLIIVGVGKYKCTLIGPW